MQASLQIHGPRGSCSGRDVGSSRESAARRVSGASAFSHFPRSAFVLGPPTLRFAAFAVAGRCLYQRYTRRQRPRVFRALRRAQAGFGLKISPSAVLKNLLQHYPSGGQFIFEALQNAEDTDRATYFGALLDLTTHPATQIRPGVWRKRLQGPAIVFYDNGGFQDRDWQSLQRIYDSVKKHCPSEVGKYGMGSRSFFHIGDIIQIVSGSKYAILDPDERLSSDGQLP
ncbi:unnamed protein product, partial [Effrenium voratum]